MAMGLSYLISHFPFCCVSTLFAGLAGSHRGCIAGVWLLGLDMDLGRNSELEEEMRIRWTGDGVG